jgi:hypothetical protein
MNAVKYVFAIAICGIAFALPSSSCIAQQVTGELGSPNATTTHPWKSTSAARSEIRRGDQGESLGVDALVAAAGRPAQGRAQRVAYYDGRCRVRRAEHIWRCRRYLITKAAGAIRDSANFH